MTTKIKRTAKTKRASEIILVADVGGTTTRLGIAELGKGKPKLLLIEETPTSHIKNIATTCKGFLTRTNAQLGQSPKRGCVAAAGPCVGNKVTMTNAKLVVDGRQLSKRTGVKILVINDFEALAYAIPILGEHDLVMLRKGKGDGPIALVGAGTGLGKAVIRNEEVLPSEGGHAEFPFQENQQPLRDFLMKELGTAAITYEDILSGRGLERLYRYLRQTAFRQEDMPDRLNAVAISATAKGNRCSETAMELFVRLLGRCCRNFVLETAAFGGLYVAGGIATRNSDALGQHFLREFSNHPDKQYRTLLERVPIGVIARLDAGLLGAALHVEAER
jgi:glucokinase